MTAEITLKFADGATYRFTEEDNEESPLVAGSWEPPYPNTAEDSQVVGLMEGWYQTDDHPVPSLSEKHGEPVRVTISSGDSDEGIYRFHWHCGRQGDLDGLFVASKEEVDNLIGKTVYFGEVLGKHSDIYGTIEPGEITLVNDAPEFIAIFKENSMSTGFNPLEYFEEEEED